MIEVRQQPPMPSKASRIVSIGAGGIVRNAHYPAYRKAGFNVAGIFDLSSENALLAQELFPDASVFSSLNELLDSVNEQAIYDLALPGSAVAETLERLPDGAYVLIQKPLGETLEQAQTILEIVERKSLNAAVNFQLRWAPYTLAAKDLIAAGIIGEPHELHFEVCVYTPWALWTFLEKAPRMEMVYHSIHYIDLIRHLFGEPNSVLAHSIKDPRSPKLESSRSTVIFDYGDWNRATVHTYHGHISGPRHQESYYRIEGPQGAIKVQMGLNMNYPAGAEDYLEYHRDGMKDWVRIPLEGSWFPNAFVGPMAAMMIWQEGGDSPSTEVHDAMKTMQWVDAAYRASDIRGLSLS